MHHCGYIPDIADKWGGTALWGDEGLSKGVCSYREIVLYENDMRNIFNLEYRNLEFY